MILLCLHYHLLFSRLVSSRLLLYDGRILGHLLGDQLRTLPNMESDVSSYDVVPTVGEIVFNISEIPDPDDQDIPWCPKPRTGINLTETQPYVLRITCGQLQDFCHFCILIDVYIIGVLSILGLIGNSQAFVVLRCDSRNKAMAFFLQALVVADNAYLIICLFLPMMKTINDCTDWLPGLYLTFPFMEPYLWPLASMTQMTGVWLVVLVTLDRYLAICHPFHRLHTWMNRHARKGVLIIPIIALLYNIPRFFEKCVIIGPDLCDNNIRKASARSTALRKQEDYIFIYKTVLFFPFRMIVPLLSLMILNVKLMLTLKEANRVRARLTTCQASSKDSFILVSVVSVFILCQVPDFFVRGGIALKSYGKFKYDFTYWTTITNMLLSVNSCINVIIYCLTGKRFRTILKELLCHPVTTLKHGPTSLLRHRTDTLCSSLDRTHFSMVSMHEKHNGQRNGRSSINHVWYLGTVVVWYKEVCLLIIKGGSRIWS